MVKISRWFVASHLLGFENLAFGLFAPSWPDFVIGLLLLIDRIGALIRVAHVRDEILRCGLDPERFELAPKNPWACWGWLR